MPHDCIALPGQDTLVACWSALAGASRRAHVTESADSVAAVFPEWAPLNNAILLRGPERAADEVTRLARIYDAAGVDTWALWLPTDATTFDEVDVARIEGLTRDTTTVAMTARFDRSLRVRDGVVETSVASAVQASGAPVPVADLDPPEPAFGLSGWVSIEDGHTVAGLWTFLHGDDCGIYGVGTVPRWRRRGIARALVEHALVDGVQKGARTSSLQSTRMGLPLYESLGFVPVGRYEEWLWTSTALEDDVETGT